MLYTNPEISIIIPFFNNIEWLEQAVNSVFEQNFNDFELIIINDGSTENINDSKIDFSNEKIIYKYKENSGPGESRNLGIELSRGTYIAFLDADDLFLPNKLEKQLKFMKKNKISFTHTNYLTFDEHQKKKKKDTSWFSGDMFVNSFVSLPIATPTVMIEKRLLEDSGYRFANHMRYGEDGYLWIQLLKENKVYSIDEELSAVRTRGKNTSRRVLNQLKAKSHFYHLIKGNIDEYKGNKSLNSGIIVLYKACSILDGLLGLVSNLPFINKVQLEQIARVLYSPIWVCFKIYKKKLFK